MQKSKVIRLDVTNSRSPPCDIAATSPSAIHLHPPPVTVGDL